MTALSTFLEFMAHSLTQSRQRIDPGNRLQPKDRHATARRPLKGLATTDTMNTLGMGQLGMGPAIWWHGANPLEPMSTYSNVEIRFDIVNRTCAKWRTTAQDDAHV